MAERVGVVSIMGSQKPRPDNVRYAPWCQTLLFARAWRGHNARKINARTQDPKIYATTIPLSVEAAREVSCQRLVHRLAIAKAKLLVPFMLRGRQVDENRVLAMVPSQAPLRRS
jgi:hypothetical protein